MYKPYCSKHGLMMYNFFLLIFTLIISSVAHSEVLKHVVVSGNKKTSTSAILKHGGIIIGEDLSDKKIQNIKDNLGRIGQFRLLAFSFKDGILTIAIEEKWTFYPVPTITQSGNYYNRGFLIYEDNFLGTLGTLAPGISWSNSNLNYLLYYQDESLFNPSFGIKLLLMRKSEYVEFKRTDQVIDAYESRFNSYLLTPNYLYKDQVFKAGPVYIDKSIHKNANEVIRDQSKGLFFRHHWNAYQVLEVMSKGFVTTFDFYGLKNQSGKMIYLNEANIYWSIPTKENFINFGIYGYLSSDKSYLFAKNIGGDEGFRGYDKASFPVSHNIATLIQYQQHLFQRFFLSPFYEHNSGKLINTVYDGKSLNENTVGIGLRYYFKKISIPAVIFDMARNIEDKSNHFHFNVGLSI